MDFDEIKKMLRNPFKKEYKKRFTIKIGQYLKVTSIEEVDCFFSKNKGIYINKFDNRNYLIESTLEFLKQELDAKEFYRINRKVIIPIGAIKAVSKKYFFETAFCGSEINN